MVRYQCALCASVVESKSAVMSFHGDWRVIVPVCVSCMSEARKRLEEGEQGDEGVV